MFLSWQSHLIVAWAQHNARDARRIFYRQFRREFVRSRAAETAPHGYTGLFHIFGHGRLPHPLVSQQKTAVVTDAVRRTLDHDGELEHVAVVPIAYGHSTTNDADPQGALKYDSARLATYD